MSDLTEFLLARIAEDEEIAREATNDGHVWLVEEETISLWPDDLEPATGHITFPRKAHAYHAATWNPGRVLAMCEAHRRIVAEFVAAMADPDLDVGERFPQGYAAGLDLAARTLATIWADHPDYREWAEWRPWAT